jgi:hypothetical protein
MNENHESADIVHMEINKALTYQWAQENYHELNLTTKDLDQLVEVILKENPQGVSIEGMQTELAKKLEPRALAPIFHRAEIIYPEFNLKTEYLQTLVNEIKAENTGNLSIDEIAIKLKYKLDKLAGAFQ